MHVLKNILIIIYTGLYCNSLLGSEFLHLNLMPPTSKVVKFESSHRAKPVKQYWLQESTDPKSITAWLHQANGEIKKLQLHFDESGGKIIFKSKWADKATHGPNRIFVVSEILWQEKQIIRTAQWLNLNHSCAWGHPFKFTPERLQLTPDPQAPLEIMPIGFWDSNLHDQLDSAHRVTLQILHFGNPAAQATLLVTTGNGWQKRFTADKQGKVTLHLIRDHYPTNWYDFQYRHPQRVWFEASYSPQEQGPGYTASLPYRYTPTPYDYKSLTWGLWVFIIASIMTIGAIIIFRYQRKIRVNPKL
ncbi:hypothetical protein TI05_11010 [Achromatium sp. WMS3]|nr:hypothetical protein TI05_11010 [Achromatium sp. WMS3]